jgi:hypothetical protein
MATAKTKPVPEPLVASTRDWKTDQAQGYVAHFIPPVMSEPDKEGNQRVVEEGYWEGPDDAFVWLGHPFEGPPWSTQIENPITGEMDACKPFLDQSKMSSQIAGVNVKWIAWDASTGCNVYQRVA